MVERPRMVRCAKCAHDWLATAIDENPLPEPPIEEPAETGVTVHEPAGHRLRGEVEGEPAGLLKGIIFVGRGYAVGVWLGGLVFPRRGSHRPIGRGRSGPRFKCNL